ncbi:MAG: FlgD immunoglobulin-like domain containing protein, partial [Bacteroidota bacterium]|nr:FlgD immunoglobulin-like domain containing protein [Bacteroidota bacterium]
GGHDLEFQSFWIWMTDTSATIRLTDGQPQTIPLDRNYFTDGFRYRLRLKANNNSANISPADDNDPWYIDHFTLMIPRRPELEVKWARVVTPYTKIPFSAAAALPVYLGIRSIAEGFGIPTSIKAEITDEGGNSVYFQSMPLNSMPAGGDTVIRMPDWNAQSVIKTSSKFTVTGSLSSSSFDEYTQDDETFSTYFSNIETGTDNSAFQEFAYDDAGISPNAGGGNDIPFIAQITGAGIGFQNGSGSYAVKFTLPFADTIQGARIYFAGGNPAPDAIRISILEGNPNSCVPGEVVQMSGSPATIEEARQGGLFNQFWAYFFPKPIVLPRGVYWMSVSQLSLNTMTMGGDLSRGGGVITVADDSRQQIAPLYSSPYGTQWSPTQNNGDVSCAFAVETMAGSGNWSEWMPPIGFWPTNVSGHSNQALSWDPTLTAPYIKAGSFMPMIRVIAGSLQSIHSEVNPPAKEDFGFGDIYPNPFTPVAKAIKLSFTLTEDAPYSLVIDDEFGREVRVLAKEKLEKGSHAAFWDGRDDAGAYVPPGVYFCRLQTADRTAIVKILVVE